MSRVEPRSWPYTSAESLARAGYVRKTRIFCRRCGHEVWLYALPGNSFRTMLLELSTFAPHRLACPPARATKQTGMQQRLMYE